MKSCISVCGRFYIENDIKDIVESYGIINIKNIRYSKGEIFPGTNIPIIFKYKSNRRE